MGTHSSETVSKDENGEGEESYGIDLQMIFVVGECEDMSCIVQHLH